MAVHLTVIPEGAPVLARRAKLSNAEAAALLNRMARRGLIYSMEKEGKAPLYMAAQFVVGIWEYHVNDLDEELIGLMNEYVPTLFKPDEWKQSPQLRTIPVDASIKPSEGTLSYEQARELVHGRKKYLVAPCICFTHSCHSFCCCSIQSWMRFCMSCRAMWILARCPGAPV